MTMDSREPDDPAIESGESNKRPRITDNKYPRKRSSKACHVCRARKTKCDNIRPACGFCVSLNISCSYDDTERDHSSFDPASLEILRQLGNIINSQQDVLSAIRTIPIARTSQPTLDESSDPADFALGNVDENRQTWGTPRTGLAQRQGSIPEYDWVPSYPDLTATSPAISTGVAAVQWFELLTRAAPLESQDDEAAAFEGNCLDQSNWEDESATTPLQYATKMIDDQPPANSTAGMDREEKSLWQTPQGIVLLEHEQTLFASFLGRICSWIDLFDTTRQFSTTVPRLATRNAGLLNAILALSGYHQSLDETVAPERRIDQNSALQYYYQTLHYVQKAMRYMTYQHSLELLATTIIISTYEMLRDVRKDWQQHLKGVFWILRSRQIEVEVSSLESSIWWAWLRQDIWVAFREKRRTYSTWTPKKSYSELGSYEIASRAIWILAQVVNFCAVDPNTEQAVGTFAGRIGCAKALRRLLQEWKEHLTIDFSELETMGEQSEGVFRPRYIHPQCFGLAMQIHYVSQILICAHEPNHGDGESFMARSRIINESAEIVCGIGSTITDEASCMLSSQCLFIAGMFLHSARQRSRVLEILDEYRLKCGCLMPSLSSELERLWSRPAYIL